MARRTKPTVSPMARFGESELCPHCISEPIPCAKRYNRIMANHLKPGKCQALERPTIPFPVSAQSQATLTTTNNNKKREHALHKPNSPPSSFPSHPQPSPVCVCTDLRRKEDGVDVVPGVLQHAPTPKPRTT